MLIICAIITSTFKGEKVMKEFKKIFEALGYTFQSADVLEDVYLFYKYYHNSANKGVSAILLEGDPGCGKTFLSETFAKFLGNDTEYIYTQCVEETNSDRLIATYNVPAIVKGDAEKSVAEGILTKAINLANGGKKVVLTIDELDKAREVLDSYFLDFLQNGKIETSNNEILSLTNDGRKNLYVILAKNNERNLLDALLRRCSVIKLPPMPPVLAYKTLLKRFENVEHDPKFLKFICKVYESIYNEQMNSNEELLTRLPALQELITAITSDYELYSNGISSTRRINSLIRKLGKDDDSREKITNILIGKFKYQNQPSNYSNEPIDFDLDSPEDYMSEPEDNITSNSEEESLIEQYIEKKENGEFIFDEDDVDDPMRDIANILDNMKDDKTLDFISQENKEKIVELGIITHKNPEAIRALFKRIKLEGNPNSKFGFLYHENDNFISLIKYRDTLILVANKEHISPKLFICAMKNIIACIHKWQIENSSLKNNGQKDEDFYYEMDERNFNLTALNVKILSNIPTSTLAKMKTNNGIHVYQAPNLQITYDDTLDINYFHYSQRFNSEPILEVLKKMCFFNPELALPATSILVREYNQSDNDLYYHYSDFKEKCYEWKRYEQKGWNVSIDEFTPMKLILKVPTGNVFNPFENKEGEFVFKWIEEKDEINKTLHIYPKYMVKGNYLFYTNAKEFFLDSEFKRLNSIQKEIVTFARNIIGNFVLFPQSRYYNQYILNNCYPVLGIVANGIVDRFEIAGCGLVITKESKFSDYYNTIIEAKTVVSSEKVLKSTLK